MSLQNKPISIMKEAGIRPLFLLVQMLGDK